MSPQPSRKRSKLPFVLGGAGALLALCVGAAVIGGASEDTVDDSSTAARVTTPATTSAAAAQPATEAATTHSAKAAATTTKTKAKPTTPVKMIKVPNGVGLDYQSAQDRWRAAGLIVAPATDATGAHRLPLIDANWMVLAQKPKAGAKVPAHSLITATVKKYSDG